MKLKILIVEDDRLFRELVRDILKKNGYEVIEAVNGKVALDIIYSSTSFDLVIIDVMMPEMDGWELLKEIRLLSSEVPVLMLTALGDEQFVVQGLRGGADDYIGKPFSYGIFVARVEALLRKRKKIIESYIQLDNLMVDSKQHRVFIGEREIILNRKEFALLLYFIEKKARVLTREKILNDLWGFDFYGDMRTVDTHVKTLRAKLCEYGKLIKTSRGTGYIFQHEEAKE